MFLLIMTLTTLLLSTLPTNDRLQMPNGSLNGAANGAYRLP
jgi:hypothetical protein